jgi:hypothetical protein
MTDLISILKNILVKMGGGDLNTHSDTKVSYSLI